ncbi:MAG: hypothetical protein MJ232_00260 [archaeon]|nr:hypothetical protein [archaeon]
MSNENLANMYLRFSPPMHVDNVKQYVTKSLTDHHSFYSFLAEAILPIVYRDVYGCKLVHAAIDINDTLIDVKTGPDDCLVDFTKGKIILSEAKFIPSLKTCIAKITDDFCKKDSIINKLDGLYRSSLVNSDTKILILQNIGKTQYKSYDISEFLSQEIILCGFAIHELAPYKLEDFEKEDFYNEFKVDHDKLANKIKKEFTLPAEFKYKIVIFHLFVDSKIDSITNFISKAQSLKEFYEKL